MRNLIAGTAILAACAATSACGQHREDPGPTVSRNFQVGNFQEIEVAGPYDVRVRTGGNPAVAGSGPQKLIDGAVVEVQGDKLVIHPPEQHGFFHWGWGNHGKAVFSVTVPQLRAATLAGAGDLSVDNVKGDQFEGKLAGAGDLTIGSANVQFLKLAIAGSGDAKVGTGQAQTAEYAIVGAGDVDATGITTQQLKVSIAGSGDIKAHATGSADVNIMGSGDVTVTGGAKCNVSKAGSGDVHCS